MAVLCWAAALGTAWVDSAHAAPSPAPEIATVDDPLTEALWPDQDEVTVEELFAQLDRVADTMAESEVVRADYDALVDELDLADSDALYRDYVRVKLAFEATRDGGWWNLTWTITNEKPNSEQIWKQWKSAATPDPEAPTVSAFAECDELSAMFAFSARKLGVRHIGLMWPEWNHVIAVWTLQSAAGEDVRIIVPTSQVWLGPMESLGTDGFDPWTQKTIYEYRRRDVKSSHRLDADLARFMVREAARHGAKSQRELSIERNARRVSIQESIPS